MSVKHADPDALRQRTIEIFALIRRLPPDSLTATALVCIASIMAREGDAVSREQWLATCNSCFDAVPMEKA